MAYFDMPHEELVKYLPERDEPADFDAFWEETLAETREHPLQAVFEPADSCLSELEVFDVTFNGYAGNAIKGWLILPRHKQGELPCVVTYQGYSGGRGVPEELTLYAAAGYAQLMMDSRGQDGDTPDPRPDDSCPNFCRFMTSGVLDPKTYYYRRLFTDGVRAVAAARAHSRVDASRICVAGGSQGGGITVAVAGLMPDVQLAMPDVPFLCHYRRATSIVDSHPYREISDYCQRNPDKVDQVFDTLRYFDGVNLAARAKATALFSVGQMDMTCPPSTVYAAYNHYAGEKDIRLYRFNGHEGGGSTHTKVRLGFLAEHWA